MSNILIIDDEPSILKTLGLLLKKHGFNVQIASDSRNALEILFSFNIDIVFLDIKLGNESGIELLKTIRAKYSEISIIMISAYSSMDDTLKALELGAESYIAKPVRAEEAIFQIGKINEKKELINRNKDLKKLYAKTGNKITVIGASDSMQEIFSIIERVKDLPSPVLIEGESGTGKEVIAKAIHHFGIRHDKPFIGINCSAIPSSLFESEIFGYKKGSFTGAIADYNGLFSQAEDGTFYLDDVDDIPFEFQPKLLRVLQENVYRRIGDPREYELNCRIIASSKVPLEKKIENKEFREDLFYRLNIININLPPLRKRREDIIPLAEYFLENKQAYLGIRGRYLSESAREYLVKLDYKGNIRELENLIERALVFSKGSEITKRDLLKLSREEKNNGEDKDLKEMMKREEARIISETLRKCQGNRTLAAKELSISIRALLYKIKEYKL